MQQLLPFHTDVQIQQGKQNQSVTTVNCILTNNNGGSARGARKPSVRPPRLAEASCHPCSLGCRGQQKAVGIFVLII